MLANLHSCFPFCLIVVFLLACALPVVAQVHGIPPSVTSFGFGGSNNPTPGIRASVTSLGPYGYGSSAPFIGNCCGSFFWQPGYGPFDAKVPLRSHRRHHHDDATIVPLVTPVYVPYAAAYGDDGDEDAADSPDAYASGPGAGRRDDHKRVGPRDVGDESARGDATEAAPPVQPEEPVVAQPSTILVFKDGHRSDVVNYAIIGDTLFDFAGDRTHKILLADLDLSATQKANDEKGVEFTLPPTSK